MVKSRFQEVLRLTFVACFFSYFSAFLNKSVHYEDNLEINSRVQMLIKSYSCDTLLFLA